MHDIDSALIQEVNLLCLDAGNTIVFLEHARLAATCMRQGFATSAEALVRAEGDAKVALECGDGVDVVWAHAGLPGGRGWGLVVGTMLNRAGLSRDRVPHLLDAQWPAHRERNFWSLVPDGLPDALGRARARGVLVAVISNSEGFLEEILRDIGIMSLFDLVIDSGIVGVEKPDPAIFRIALDRTGVDAPHALHLGDTYATDVVGARAAGIRAALIDPYGHLSGRHPDVPRVPGAPQVANAIALART